MSKKIKLIWILLVATLILSGCGMRTVGEMYRLPKRSENYNNLQSVIDDAMAGLEYCAPLTGENRQTVQIADLDGDGIDEYLLFAKGTQQKPLRILVFQSKNGTFVNLDVVECNGSAFDQVEYVDMNGDGGVEVIVGHQLSDQVIRSATVYTLENEKLNQLVSANYTKFMMADLDGDNLSELFLLRPSTSDSGNGVAELYTMKNGAMERYNEANMSQPAEKLKRMIIGKLNGGKTAIYAASLVGDTELMTDVYSVIDGRLTNITFSNESGTSIQTTRSFYIYADDIDNDGVVELPNLMSMRPVEGAINADMHHLIRWYAMTPDGDEVDKMHTYHNFSGGWYMQLDSQWASRLAVLNLGNQTEFYIWNKNYDKAEKVLTIYAFSGQSREEMGLSEDRFVLNRTDSIVYAAKLEETAAKYNMTKENVVYSFRMIQQDWKTGET